MNRLTEQFFKASTGVFTQSDVAASVDGTDFSRHGLIKRAMSAGDILEVFKQRLFKAFLLLNLPDKIFMPDLLEMDEIVFAKTKSRSVVGSMNDIIAQAKFSCDYHDMDVDSPAMFESLSQIPLKANGYRRSTEPVAELLRP